jgi:hypothetical protein
LLGQRSECSANKETAAVLPRYTSAVNPVGGALHLPALEQFMIRTVVEVANGSIRQCIELERAP